MSQLITDHLATWTTAPKGIKKLRELILELAVRGLLVPQDANDELASVLLTKIAAEKARLVGEGKIKPPKPLAKISEGEKPFCLPMGWEFVRLDDLSQIITKGSSPKWQGVSYTDNENDVLFITSENVGSFSLKLESKKYVALKFNEIEPRSILKNGDFLMNIVGGSIGRTAIYDIEVVANINQAVCLIRCFPELLNSRFLLNFFNSQICISYMFDKQVDNARANLSMGNISKFLIPLPPEQEQQRIVAKVDELMQLCDQLEEKQSGSQAMHRQLVNSLLSTLTEAADAQAFQAAWSQIAANFDCLFTTEHSIEQLKQTILQLAVMGKLVPQDPNDEPASELLNKIATEKARLIAEGKIKKQNPLPKINEQEKPFALPNGWKIARLGEVINLISGQHLNPDEYSISYKTGMIPYLSGPADFGAIYPEPNRYTVIKRAVALSGNILITCKGSGLGKINKANNEIAIGRQLMSIQSILLDNSYTELLALSLKDLLRTKSIGIAIPGISREDILEAIVYLAPLPEQHRIVTKVDELMTLCEQLKTKLASEQTLQQQLAETLVQQAVA